MDSVVGRSVIVQTRGQLQPAVIRAASQPISPGSDCSKTEVLLEWEGEGEGSREWVHLGDSSTFQALYVESKLLWAKRIITVEQQRRAVAWPSKAYILLCSSVQHYPETMIVEYFCDRERVQLYVQESQQETKELHLSEAKGTLISHPYLLAELEEWEESQTDHTHLMASQTSLVGRTVSVCNVQGVWPRWITGVVSAHNLQTKMLSVQEEGSQTSHSVNPLTVHVLLRQPAPGEGGLQRTSSLHSLQPHQQPPSHHVSNPDLLLEGSGEPSLLSPSLQDTTSPVFPSNLSSLSPVTAYRTPSIDLHRRSSLQILDTSCMSEPNIFRRSSLDPLSTQKVGGLCNIHQDGVHTSPLVRSPTHSMHMPAHSSQHGTGMNRVPSNSLVNEQGFAGTSPQGYLQQERSKSLENINSLQPVSVSHTVKRRMSTQVLPSTLPSKRPRFDLIPPIGDMRASPEPSLPSSLHRSMSLSALPRGPRHPFGLGGRGHSTSDNHDDELDMIKEIIDRDDSLVATSYHHSLTNIPAELSISLPALHPSEGLQVLNTYNSAPAIAHASLSRPLSSLKPSLNINVSDFPCDPLHPRKESNFSSDIFPFSASLSPSLQQLYMYSQPQCSAQSRHADSAHSSSTEQKPLIASFSSRDSCALTTTPHSSHLPNLTTTPHSPHLPNLTTTPHSPHLPNLTTIPHSPHLPNLTTTPHSPHLPNLTTTPHSPHLTTTPHSPHLPNLTDMLQTDSLSTSLLRSALASPAHPVPAEPPTEPAQIAREAELCGGKEDVTVEGNREGIEVVREGGELDISVIVNHHVNQDSGEESLSTLQVEGGKVGREGEGKPGRAKQFKKTPQVAKEAKGGGASTMKRGRGRPRLTEEEKQRRKELRELGLMKRSHRRTKEEVAQWRAERILSPAKRGRKPGSGKKNVVKAVTGKEVYVSVDLSKYSPGSVLLQNGFCRAFPGIPRCLECSTSDGDLPLNRYCRFLEFRKILIIDSAEPRLQVEGFANYTDVQAADLVPWTPLKVGYSHMDANSALLILRRVAPHFLDVVTAEAATLPEGEVTPIWKRAVQGLREMCDTCDTTLFNFHWVCPQCGFCICPTCYQLAWDLEEGYDGSSSSHGGWPTCASTSLPHLSSSLIVAQIIPANVLSDVLSQMLKICEAHHIRQEVPRPLQQLISVISQQTPQSRFQNDRKGKGSRSRSGKSSLEPGGSESSLPSPPASLQSSPPDSSPLDLAPTCSNGREEAVFPSSVPHTWLCEGTLLCLQDPSREDNMLAFQHQWRRGMPVLVVGVDKQLSPDMWTPQSFSRDFGEEYSELVDCRGGFPLPQYPSHVFWDGFEDISKRLRDPRTGEPRLLKLKDWPPGDDFSEKLPKRFADLADSLPLPHYTRRDGKLNMASSLPNFFVKPDMGPKMYNAYGSPAYPSSGTTNLHLDISDAVNVMVYCSIPVGAEEDEAGMIGDMVQKECCQQTCWRITSNALRVGALWHIYAASDTDTIRVFLRKVFEERGLHQTVGTDPIHDQLVYLDSDLRQRLLQEHGVRGWTIAQSVGDAIFIPAGAPHQVRNLCSCIKVAEDFVSPEHIHECVKLTEEFRQLSDRHVNHEDKLQVKNIMYHSVKDIVGILKSTMK